MIIVLLIILYCYLIILYYIINYRKCVYIVCNLWLFYIIIVIVPFESSITMSYTVTEHNCDYYEHNVQKNIMKMIYI